MIKLRISTPVEAGTPKWDVYELEWSGQTARGLAAPWVDGDPVEEIIAILDGKVLEGDEWDKPLNKDADLSFLPRLSSGKSLARYFSLMNPFTASYTLFREFKTLFAKPRIPDAGDDLSSPTYGFNMTTAESPGLAVPLLYGEHDTGGMLVHSEIAPEIGNQTGLNPTGNTGNEEIKVILGLSSGPIDSIGGETNLNRLGGKDQVAANPLPANLRINGNLVERNTNPPAGFDPEVAAQIRLGELDDAEFDPNFIGMVKTTVAVNGELDEQNQSSTVTISSTILQAIWVNIRFPNGLYRIEPNTGLPVDLGPLNSPTGTAIPIKFRIETRDITDPGNPGAWIATDVQVNHNDHAKGTLGSTTVQSAALRQAFTIQFEVAPPFSEPLGLIGKFRRTATSAEVKVTRLSLLFQGAPETATDPGTVAGAVFKDVIYGVAQGLAYPDLGKIAINAVATDRFSSGSLNFRVRAKGKKVRVWDATEGFSEPTWEVPASPFDWMTYAPGQSPAWVLLDFLTTDQGLGEWLSDDDIDLPSFRNWADYCDDSVTDPGAIMNDALYRWDGLLDEQRGALDWVEQILSVGNAAMVQVGSKYKVVYKYRDAHGRGTNSVPALATGGPTDFSINHAQLFNSANLSEFQVNYHNLADRPTVIEGRFSNESIDYERDLVIQEDPNALGVNETPGTVLNALGIVKKSVDYMGVTRAKQARYLALLEHNENRLSRKTYTFTAGVDSIAVEPGDLIAIQSTALRIGTNQSFGLSVNPGHTGNSINLQLTEAVSIPANEDWSVFVLDSSNAVVEGLIAQDASPRTFAAGDNIPILDPAGTNPALTINYEELRPVAIGPQDSTVDSAMVMSVELQENLQARIVAQQWDPAIYNLDSTDVQPPAAAGGEGAPTYDDDGVDQSTISTAGNPAETTPDPVPGVALANIGGALVLSWDYPTNSASTVARIYTRPSSSSRWQFAGEVTGTSTTLGALSSGQSIQVAVSTQDAQGNFATPGDALQATFTAPEFSSLFPIPQVQGFTATVQGEGILFEWNTLSFAWLDYYEIRRGTIWNHAPVVARVKECCLFHVAGPGSYSYMIRARHNDGLYSARLSSAGPVDFADVVGTTVIGGYPSDDLVSAAAGTVGTGLSYDATNDWLELDADALTGVYTAVAIDGSTVADRWWAMTWDQHCQRTDLVDDLTFTCDGGDAMWWTTYGREATPGTPGLDYDLELTSSTLAVEHAGRLLTHEGSVGSYADIKAEMRFHDGGTWGSWEPYAPGLRNAQQFQGRLTFNRSDYNEELRLSKLSLTGAAI